MIAITGAILALGAGLVPNARACSNKLGAFAMRAPAILPSVMTAAPNDTSAATPARLGISIVGLWSVTFYSEGTAVDVAFDAWHSDGTEILNDFTDPIEGNVCLGAWAQTGLQTFKLTHPSWTFDSNGNLTGTAYILETVTVTSGGSQYQGTYTINYYDTSGNPEGSFSGTLSATRISPN
jgi:hypothetical protein